MLSNYPMHRSADSEIVATVSEPIWEAIALCALLVGLLVASVHIYMRHLRSAAGRNQVNLSDFCV